MALVGGKETWVRVHVQDRHAEPIAVQATLADRPSDPVLGFSSVDSADPELRGGSLTAVTPALCSTSLPVGGTSGGWCPG